MDPPEHGCRCRVPAEWSDGVSILVILGTVPTLDLYDQEAIALEHAYDQATAGARNPYARQIGLKINLTVVSNHRCTE